MNHRFSTGLLGRVALAVALTGPAVMVGCQIADPKPRNRSMSAATPPERDATAEAPLPAPRMTDARRTVTAANAATAPQARERAIEVIETMAKSAEAQLRANAVELAGLAPQRLHAVLQAGLLDPNAGVRSVAVIAAGRGRLKEFREIIRPLARDQSGTVRAGAIYALERFGDAPDQTPLASMLLNDDSPWVNRQAAFVLGELGNPTALPLLHSAWANRVSQLPPAQQPVFQVQLTEAMVKLGDEAQRTALIAALYPTQAEGIETSMLAVQAIGETGDKTAVAQLIGLAQYRDREGNPYPAELRLAIATTLGRLGMESGLSVADELVGSEDEALRAQAAHAHGHIGAGGGGGPAGALRAVERLRPMLEDESALVRLAAAGGVLRCTR